jgi:cytochrome b561
MPTDQPAGWSRAQRRLHWWIAALIILGFALGWLMVAVPLAQLLTKFLLYQLHKTIGLTVLLLAVLRIAVRLRHGRPPWEADLPAWQRHAAATVHALLYLLILATPILGYFTAATAPAQVPTLYFLVIPVPHLVGPSTAAFGIVQPLHRALAILLILLASGHAAMAIRHHSQGRATLTMMWRGTTARPPAAAPQPPLRQDRASR